MKLPKITIEHLWIILIIGTVFGYVCTVPVDEIDFWHYLKAGEFMMTSHKFIDKDIFSFTMLNQSYVNFHWASQVIYYLLYSAGGLYLIEFIHALIITASFILLFFLAKERTENIRIASASLFITFMLSATNFSLRPQSFSILFFVLTMYLLHKRILWAIPLLILIWTNVHAAFLLGLILILIEWVCSIKNIKSIFNSPFLYTLITSFLTTLLNPSGIGLYKSVFAVESVSRKVSYITEWETPSIHDTTGLLFYAALILLFVLLNISKAKLNRKDLLTFLIFSFLALSCLRSVVWWALIMTPVFAEVLGKVFKKGGLPNSGTSLPFVNFIIVLVFTLYLTGCIPWLKVNNPFLPASKRLLINDDTPLEIANFIKENHKIKNIFNDYSWGSYFIWALRNDQKVFYDPRCAIFPQKVISDYLLITGGDYSWESLLKYYRVDALALSKNEQNELILLVKASADWKKVYEDKLGIVFLKQTKRIG